MKKLSYTLIAVLLTCQLFAQSSDLNVRSEGGKLFLYHTVAPKENLYSIGRLYNISPREIAPMNGLTLTSGLEIDQVIKIPLTNSNFFQQGTAAADEVFVPLYYTVAEKEGLFRIGQNVNKVSADNLKKWNGLTSDNISAGQQLVVGYLKVKKELSVLAANGIKRIGPAVTTAPPTVVENINNVAVVNEVPPAVTNTPASTPPPATNTQTAAQPTSSQQPAIVTVQTNNNAAEGIGFFKSVYLQQSRSSSAFRNVTGAAAIFKSTSGWQDAKYYALMNNIAPGTIVRITNSVNSRTIYAKVLGELPPGKENEGLLIRISNAAAAELRVNEKEPRFNAEVAYSRS